MHIVYKQKEHSALTQPVYTQFSIEHIWNAMPIDIEYDILNNHRYMYGNMIWKWNLQYGVWYECAIFGVMENTPYSLCIVQVCVYYVWNATFIQTRISFWNWFHFYFFCFLRLTLNKTRCIKAREIIHPFHSLDSHFIHKLNSTFRQTLIDIIFALHFHSHFEHLINYEFYAFGMPSFGSSCLLMHIPFVLFSPLHVLLPLYVSSASSAPLSSESSLTLYVL